MHTFRSWLMGAKWTNNVPLKILSVFPGGTIIKPDSEWLVKVAFNREPEDARPAVRFETQDGKQEIPLVRISEREYQALMPPFTGECRYAVCAENRHTEYFTNIPNRSSSGTSHSGRRTKRRNCFRISGNGLCRKERS